MTYNIREITNSLIVLGLLALMLSSLFPAREFKGNVISRDGRNNPPRGFLFSSLLIENNKVGIAMERMILEWVFIISVTGLLVMYVNYPLLLPKE